MYYVETMEKPKKLWYDDIKQLRILKSSKKDCNRELAIDFLDGSTFYIEGSFINKTPLKNFLNEMKNFEANKKAEKKKIENEKKNNFGAESAGRGIGAFRTVNNQFEEEKFHSRQGHGFPSVIYLNVPFPSFSKHSFIHLFPVAQYFDCIFTPSTTLSAPFLALSSPTIFASCPVSLSNRLLALSASRILHHFN